MKRLYINRAVAFVLLSAGVTTLIVLAAPYEICPPLAVNTVRVSTDAGSPPNSAMPHGALSHCLVYGKYCVGEALHGK